MTAQDQRALEDQLRDAYTILNAHGLYDAADYVRRGYDTDTDATRERSNNQLRARKISKIIVHYGYSAANTGERAGGTTP